MLYTCAMCPRLLGQNNDEGSNEGNEIEVKSEDAEKKTAVNAMVRASIKPKKTSVEPVDSAVGSAADGLALLTSLE